MRQIMKEKGLGDWRKAEYRFCKKCGRIARFENLKIMWIGKDKWMNELWCGDNIEVLKKIPDESVDLIYIDPPFFSNRHYEVIWGNGAELRAFGDRWKGGIEHYIGWMVERLKGLHRILKPTGSIYVHLDWHAVHYLKVEMDKIFGYENFRNEIIWHYGQRTMRNKKKWNAKHDNILFYAKSKKTYIENIITQPWTEEEISKSRARKIQIDENGKKFIWDNRSVKKGVLPKKQYIEDIIKKGKAVDDVWNMPIILSTSKERLGYPTQKPEALLERIIKASSNEGDIVLDAFCGCGTTIAVAEKLNRKWIAIDVSPIAVKVTTERLNKLEKKLGKENADFITFAVEHNERRCPLSHLPSARSTLDKRNPPISISGKN